MSNEAQIDFWNGPAGDVWVEAQEDMDRMLAPLSELATARAASQANERAIDVGCGCGATTLALASSGSSVWGVDISEPMLAQAKTRAKQLGLNNVAFSVTDAASQNYTPDHDLVFSRFGVMFFDDPKAAFSNLRQSLKPDGRLVFICWQKPAENPWMSIAGRAAQPFLPESGAQDPKAPGPFAFADRDWVREILDTSGYRDISIEPVTPVLTVGKDVEEAMYIQGRIGPMARVLSELEGDVREQAMSAVRAALAEHETDAGVQLRAGAWLVTACNSD